MKPGFAYGGSCLPKDLRALSHLGRTLNVPTPMLDATREANEIHLKRAVGNVKKAGNRKVGIVGLTFKADTDDLRESAMLALAETLIGQGHEVTIYDPNVAAEENNGRNYIPHIAGRMRGNLSDVISEAQTLVVGAKFEGLQQAIEESETPLHVIDLVRVPLSVDGAVTYDGLCW